MARLLTSGFELNSIASGMEWDNTAGTASVDPTTKRSGGFAARLVDGVGQGTRWEREITSANVNGPWYIRTYINIAVMGTSYVASNQILSINDGIGTVYASIKLDTANSTLELWDNAGQIGTDSTALSTGTWYCVELSVFNNTGSAKMELSARIDQGSAFASTTTSTNTGTFRYLRLGEMNGTTGNGTDIYYDDIAVNDNSGSFQNTWPGSGKVISLRPNTTGDNAAWARGGTNSGANWSQVEEIPPNDVTDYVESGTSGNIDDYNVGASGIGSTDTVNVVEVGGRFTVSSSAGADPGFVFRVKASSGGTVEESSEIIASSTTWGTNTAGSSIPTTSPLILYDLPGASTTAWTQADLDVAQIGVRESTTDTHLVRLSAIWMFVDYTPAGAPPPSTQVATAFMTTNTNFWGP